MPLTPPRLRVPRRQPPADRRRLRRRWLVVAAALVLLGALAAACSDDADVAEQSTADGSGGGVGANRAAEPDVAEVEQPDAEGSGETAAPREGAAADEGAQIGGLGALDEADPDRRLIREGSVTVGYADAFDAAHRQVIDLAQQHGGGVLDLDSATDEEGVTRGSVTVEVPVGEYDALLEGLDEVGPVLRRDVRTEDVTEEYVDLRSRLRHLERTEQFFLDLFDEAETVDEAITIRDRLDSVQERIEEIEGRLRRIEQRTEMSRLTVELVPEDEEPHRERPVLAGFGDYWDDAREAFVGVAGTLLVLVVGGAPLVLAGAVVLGVAVVLVRARRSASAAGAE